MATYTEHQMEQLLTPAALGAMLGLAKQTIYNRYSLGADLPPAVKLGKSLRFRLSDAEAWIQSKVARNSDAVPAPNLAVRRRGRPTKAEQIAAPNASKH